MRMLCNFISNIYGNLGGGFKYFLFSPLCGEDEPILTHIFQMGWNHQLEIFIDDYCQQLFRESIESILCEFHHSHDSHLESLNPTINPFIIP